MNKNKFRVWHNGKFEYFSLQKRPSDHAILNSSKNYVHQFLGILDSTLKEVYECDIVEFILYKNKYTGLVYYSEAACAYMIDTSDRGQVPILNICLDSLKILGNIVENYKYDEQGNLCKK